MSLCLITFPIAKVIFVKCGHLECVHEQKKKKLRNPTSQKLTTALLISSYPHVSLSVSLAVSDSFCYTNKHTFLPKGDFFLYTFFI